MTAPRMVNQNIKSKHRQERKGCLSLHSHRNAMLKTNNFLEKVSS